MRLSKLSCWMVLVALAFVCGCGKDEPVALEQPTRVKVAHIMLEKHEVPAEPDAASVREAVLKKKLHEQMVSEVRDEIRRGLDSGDYVFDFKLTLLKDRKDRK